MAAYGISPEILRKKLSTENIIEEQRRDTRMSLLIERLDSDKNDPLPYFLERGVVKLKSKEPGRPARICVPELLIPYVLAGMHF